MLASPQTPRPRGQTRRRSRVALAALTVGLAVGTTALPAAANGGGAPLPPNAVEIAKSDPNLSILVQAVVKAGLADTLAAPGNLTIFAPTNDAFVALLGQLGVKSLDDIPVATLKAVLLDHVVAGELDAVDVAGRIPNHQGANAVGGLWLQFSAGPPRHRCRTRDGGASTTRPRPRTAGRTDRQDRRDRASGVSRSSRAGGGR